ncbi:hypothetical protein F8M41_000827 [Gigaspora margarita]|uniref:Uncharacterized protein n=1 Tax=Gigaspora margarita TaxID=4874 RepID=A0A8H3XFB8_GIGMA|nr:hypothetical protein F8M41_000827 [Gigaspora margarita]
MIIKVKRKENNNSMTMEKLVKINRKCTKASIRISSSSNIISMNYVEKKELNWKYSNTNDEIVEYISGVDVDVDSVKVMQKFYMKRELFCNVVLWVVKTSKGLKENEFSKAKSWRVDIEEDKNHDEVADDFSHIDVAYNYQRYYDSGNRMEDDKIKFGSNGGEAADCRANKNGIGNEKKELPEFNTCQNLDHKS